jgi:hypothetical protein
MHSPQGAAEEVFQSVDRTETILLRIRYRVAIRQSLERETLPQVHLWEMFRQQPLARDGADLGPSTAAPTSLRKGRVVIAGGRKRTTYVAVDLEASFVERRGEHCLWAPRELVAQWDLLSLNFKPTFDWVDKSHVRC